MAGKVKAKAKAKSNDGPRTARRWAVTYYDPDWVIPQPTGPIRGIMGQPEVGNQEERFHHQVYVECTGSASNKQVTEALSIPWATKGTERDFSFQIKAACGTRAENFAYCGSDKYCKTHSKGTMMFCEGLLVPDESFCDCEDAELKGQQAPATIVGTWPAGDGGDRGAEGGSPMQGAFQLMMADAKSGMGILQIRRKHSESYVRFANGVDKVVQAHRGHRQWMPKVYWLYGPAGVNKSRIAHAILQGGTYFKPPDTRWFDGYDGGDVLVLNDLRKSTFTYSYLLDLLDRYDFQVEVKGSYVPMMAKVVVITCSMPHDKLWAQLHGTENENLNQLTRRISEEINIGETSLDDQKRLVTRMREMVAFMRDHANLDKEDIFDVWDGKGDIPNLGVSARSPKRLVTHDETSALVAHKKQKVSLFEERGGEEAVEHPEDKLYSIVFEE